jgi:branched-chain amino acid transport system substrate-binding protein
MESRDESYEQSERATETDGGDRRGLSRREFLRVAAVTGGTIGAAGGLAGLITACGSAETTTTSAAPATTTTAAPATTTTAAPASSTTVSSTAETGRPVKIGYIVPITGPLASFSSGAKWAQKHFEDAIGDGIVFGDKMKHPVQVLMTDTQSDSNRAAQVTADMILNNKVDLVFASCTPPTVNPSGDVAESMATPFISNWAEWHGFIQGRKAPAEGFHWTYTYAFDDAVTAVNYIGVFNMVQTNKKVGLVLANDDDGISWSHFGPPIFEQAGFTVVMTDLYTPGAEDFTQQISVLKKEGCELMVAVMLTPDFTNYWTQARQQSYEPVVPFGQKALIFPEAVQALGETGINLCCSGTWTPRSNFKDSLTGMTCQQLADEYEAFSGNQWSEAMIILTGFEWAADIFKRLTNVDDKEEYVRMITSTKLPCMLGTIDFTLPVKEMTYHPHPNVGVPPEAAGQWIKSAAGSKWPIDKVLIYTTSPDVIAVEAKLQPMQY